MTPRDLILIEESQTGEKVLATNLLRRAAQEQSDWAGTSDSDLKVRLARESKTREGK